MLSFAVRTLQISDTLMAEFLLKFAQQYTRDDSWRGTQVKKFWAPAVEQFAIEKHGGPELHLAHKEALAARAIRGLATKDAKKALQASRGPGEAF